MSFIRARAVCAASLFFGLYALPTQADESLALADALARALRDNPELRVFPYRQRAAEAEALQAGLRPNPELEVEFENFAGTGKLHGIDELETTLSLSQLVELGGKRQRRVERAE